MTDSGGQASTGALINGRYRLHERLGRGGMGTVWRATDERLNRQVALKEPVLPEGIADEERAERYRRMEREAQAAARLRHPNIVRVHDIETVGGRPWLVMELIDGDSLEAVLAEGTLGVDEAAAIGRQLAAALVEVHAAGVVHRDLKPANIMRTRSGEVVLTDFGIAQLDGGGDLTRTGVVIGSVPYLSPERATGRRPGPGSDLWALGLVLYEAVEGTHPYRRSNSQATVAAIITDPVPAPRRAGALTVPIMSLLERDPARRPSAAQAELLLAGAATVAQPVPTALDTAPAAPTDALTVRLRAAGAAVTGTKRRRLSTLGAALAVVAGATAWLLWPQSAPHAARVPDGYQEQQVARLGFGIAVPKGYSASIGSDGASWGSPDGHLQIDIHDEGASGQGERAYAQNRLNDLKAHHSKVNCGDTVPDPYGVSEVHDAQSMLHAGGVNAAVIEYGYSLPSEDAAPCITSGPNDLAFEQYMIHNGHVLHLRVTVSGYYRQPDRQKDDRDVYDNVVGSLAFG